MIRTEIKILWNLKVEAGMTMNALANIEAYLKHYQKENILSYEISTEMKK